MSVCLSVCHLPERNHEEHAHEKLQDESKEKKKMQYD